MLRSATIIATIIMPPEETSPMLPSSDDPPGERVSRDPPAAATVETAEDASAEPVLTGELSPGGEPRKHRRRRRRRPPREIGPEQSAETGEGPSATDEPAGDRPESGGAPGIAPGGSEARDRPRRRRRRRSPFAASPAAASDDQTSSGERAAARSPEGPQDAAASGAPSLDGTLRLPFRPRRQRRRPPRRAGSAPAPTETASMDGNASQADAPPGAPRPEGEHRRRQAPQSGGGAPGQQPRAEENRRGRPDRRGLQNRGPRYRDAGAAGPRQADAPQRRIPSQDPRSAGAPGPERRGGGDRSARSRPSGGPREGQRGRGRDAPARRVEQKLYTLESMVDRGFEDVADEAEESGTRRVHWTIVKRSVADQKSGKPMSAAYVLQRDGAETEFPNLGAARAAANKTIVHPEKLTLSKAEHVAAKNK